MVNGEETIHTELNQDPLKYIFKDIIINVSIGVIKNTKKKTI